MSHCVQEKGLGASGHAARHEGRGTFSPFLQCGAPKGAGLCIPEAPPDDFVRGPSTFVYLTFSNLNKFYELRLQLRNLIESPVERAGAWARLPLRPGADNPSANPRTKLCARCASSCLPGQFTTLRTLHRRRERAPCPAMGNSVSSAADSVGISWCNQCSDSHMAADRDDFRPMSIQTSGVRSASRVTRRSDAVRSLLAMTAVPPASRSRRWRRISGSRQTGQRTTVVPTHARRRCPRWASRTSAVARRRTESSKSGQAQRCQRRAQRRRRSSPYERPRRRSMQFLLGPPCGTARPRTMRRRTPRPRSPPFATPCPRPGRSRPSRPRQSPSPRRQTPRHSRPRRRAGRATRARRVRAGTGAWSP